MKTRTYLLLMAIVILIPVIGFSWGGLDMLLTWEREAQLRSVQESARAAAVTIDREIAAAEASLKVMASSQLLKNGNFKDLHELMTRSNRTPNSWTLVSDASGRPLLNTYLPYGASLPATGGNWVDRVFRAGGLSVSNYFFGWLAQQPAVSVDMPVELAPDKKYVLSQVFYASHFTKAFQAQHLNPSWLVGIFGSDGVAIARNDQSAQRIGEPVLPELYDASRRNASGVMRFKSSSGAFVYGVYTPTVLTGWTVAIGVPVEEIEKSARQAALFSAFALGVTFALAALVAVLLGRKISRSLHHAADAASALLNGAAVEPRKSMCCRPVFTKQAWR